MSISPEMTLRYERITLDHIDDLMELENEAYPDPWTAGMFRQEVQTRTSHFFLAYIGEELVGYCGFWLMLDEAHITKVTVAEEYRRQGIGRQMLGYVLDHARRSHALTARLEVREANEAAQRLYESFGFEVTGHRANYYAKTNENAIVMTLYLCQA